VPHGWQSLLESGIGELGELPNFPYNDVIMIVLKKVRLNKFLKFVIATNSLLFGTNS
jgi:hypothetical protein